MATAEKEKLVSKIKGYQNLYFEALLSDVIPFWEKYSIDRESGGYFTCLTRCGDVYDTDKFVWLQARQVWMFSKLYNCLEKRKEWLEIARLGADFLSQYGMDKSGDWYFSLNRSGRPLVQPYNVFSDCFAAIAFSQYALASGDEKAKKIAQNTFSNIMCRRSNPKGRYSKLVPEERPLKNLGLSMILINMSLELQGVIDQKVLNTIQTSACADIMNLFLDADKKLVFENVLPDGLHLDCFEGRLINPGHGIETMWFLMDVDSFSIDKDAVEKAVDVVLNTLEYAWDQKYGGIFYFLDVQGKPMQQLEWDQKLWWVHIEALVALLKCYHLTGRADTWEWFERVHEYTWQKFPDPKYGEWFGYLDRRGERLLDIKGGKWKGCFHVPRGLYKCCQELTKILNGLILDSNRNKKEKNGH